MNDPWPRPTQGPAEAIETDYLVIGAGAMGMAFTDTLITESGARRHDRPRMSAWWTLDTRSCGTTIDITASTPRALTTTPLTSSGWNRGLNELAPVGEICAYFDAVLQQQLLPTGRVDYFPMSAGRRPVPVRRGTEYVSPSIGIVVPPACRSYAVDAASAVLSCTRRRLRRSNELPKLGTRDRYVVVSAGKTGMDCYGCSETTSALTS